MIPAAQLAQLQGALAATLPDTAHAVTHTTVPDGRGGFTQTEVAGAAFPCRLQPITREPVEGVVAAALQSHVRYWLFYPRVYPATPTPIRLTAQGAIRVGPTTYQLQAVYDPGADTLLNRALVWRDSEDPL